MARFLESASQRAVARIGAVLLEEWDALEGVQQRAIVDVLQQSTLGTEEAEQFAQRVRDRATESNQ